MHYAAETQNVSDLIRLEIVRRSWSLN